MILGLLLWPPSACREGGEVLVSSGETRNSSSIGYTALKERACGVREGGKSKREKHV